MKIYRLSFYYDYGVEAIDECILWLACYKSLKKAENSLNYYRKQKGFNLFPKKYFYCESFILDNIPIKDVILKIDDNLDLVPNADIFYKYIEFLEDAYPNRKDRKIHLTNFLKDILKDYDYIFIDVSPTLSLSNDNAFIACDACDYYCSCT